MKWPVLVAGILAWPIVGTTPMASLTITLGGPIDRFFLLPALVSILVLVPLLPASPRLMPVYVAYSSRNTDPIHGEIFWIARKPMPPLSAPGCRKRLVEKVEIFGPDGAAVGGRNAVKVVAQQHLDNVTDVIVDVSAMSTGTGFPIIRYFVEYIARDPKSLNLHVFVVHEPRLDAKIRRVAGDVPGYVHGFKGRSTLSAAEGAARLWLPQLATGANVALGRLYNFVEPHDTCPILPFPAHDPRLGDALAEEYLTELENTWSVDAHNIIYADEGDPLDLYRTILRLDDLRAPVFAETGGQCSYCPRQATK